MLNLNDSIFLHMQTWFFTLLLLCVFCYFFLSILLMYSFSPSFSRSFFQTDYLLIIEIRCAFEHKPNREKKIQFQSHTEHTVCCVLIIRALVRINCQIDTKSPQSAFHRPNMRMMSLSLFWCVCVSKEVVMLLCLFPSHKRLKRKLHPEKNASK